MGFVILGDNIEIDPVSLKKYNQNIHSLHSLCISLNNVMEDSRHYVSQVEAFMASSFTLSNDLHKIGLQFNDIGSISSSISQLNREINQLLPQSLRDCKIILDFSTENQVFFDHTETFKTIKQEIDRYLLDSIQYRRDLKGYLSKYHKAPTESLSEKICLSMAKLNLSINLYEKYLNLLENELSEFCGTRHKYLLDLSKNIYNLHHLVHFGRNLTEDSLNNINSIKQLSTKTVTHSIPLKQKVPPSTLKEIVDNPIFLKSLRIFSEKQHCLENLLFWLDAIALKDLEASSFPKDRLRSLFVNMCNIYVEPDCPFEINIDSESKLAIDRRKSNLESNDAFYPAFSQAVDSIYSLLNFSMLPLFFKSPIYNAALMMSRSYSEESLDNKGISHVLCSLDSIIRNPVSLEYFLLFIRSQTPSASSSVSPSPSFGNNLSAQQGHLLPPLALPFTPRLQPLLPTFSPNLVTSQDIENMLYFYLDINKFKDINNDDELENFALELFETYLKPTSEKRIVPISSSTIAELINGKNITRDLFSGVSQDIILHIANVYFPSFLTSQICKDMLAREEKMKRYQEKEDKKKLESKIELQFELISKEKLRTVIPNKVKSLLTSFVNIISTNSNPTSNNNNNNNNPTSPTANTTPSNMFIQYQPPNRTPSPPGFSTNVVHLEENNSNSSFNNNPKNNFINANNRNKQPQISSSLSTGNISQIANSSSGGSSSTTSSPGSSSGSVPTTPSSTNNFSNSSSNTTTPILQSTPSQITLPPLPSHLSSSSLTASSANSGGASSSTALNSQSVNTPSASSQSTLQQLQQQQREKEQSQESFSVSLFKENNNCDSPEESRSNDVFLYILTDGTWLDGYKKFVLSEKSEELLLCWMELESFFRSPQVNKLHASTIYETFFKEGSPLEVSITDSTLRSQMKLALHLSEYEVSKVFKVAAEEIIEAMRTDSFSRFTKSQFYRDLSKEHGDPVDPKNRKGFLNRKKKLVVSTK
ncbi:hypothetical protein DLAC_06259 [Tieghemostelium lacteum]|uniref:RGS domain-containing protein n=1 Tax=Tieghemostelium lacteum TaxID=361077 RepID=A0A151ZEE0_TIELA|nr:hypothetical protein DLAC_06259 [Tieghemostelium lacteum]|eukprot:KYQ92297.1 hypothetical protein DLAC_06259 [Tieghemostelium lacteum]